MCHLCSILHLITDTDFIEFIGAPADTRLYTLPPCLESPGLTAYAIYKLDIDLGEIEIEPAIDGKSTMSVREFYDRRSEFDIPIGEFTSVVIESLSKTYDPLTLGILGYPYHGNNAFIGYFMGVPCWIDGNDHLYTGLIRTVNNTQIHTQLWEKIE